MPPENRSSRRTRDGTIGNGSGQGGGRKDVGVVAGLPMMIPLVVLPVVPLALGGRNLLPEVMPGSAEIKLLALDQEITTTLMAIEVPEDPVAKKDEVVQVRVAEEQSVIEFEDKKEVIEAFEEFLKKNCSPTSGSSSPSRTAKYIYEDCIFILQNLRLFRFSTEKKNETKWRNDPQVMAFL